MSYGIHFCKTFSISSFYQSSSSFFRSPSSSVHLILLHSFSFFCSSSSYPRISSLLRLLFRLLSSFSGKSRFLFAGSSLGLSQGNENPSTVAVN
ncbi:hypothetical protein J1N35_012818 [Gossypium stocksii]|uniref:Uncharacterized protein n=1 Tax=Gossypium stocksii TaxID=47602 RepID=A0A9D4AER7_9ROSI|nr:hypothetical protein J1N35_012818 [Gossypium stocksii]